MNKYIMIKINYVFSYFSVSFIISRVKRLGDACASFNI